MNRAYMGLGLANLKIKCLSKKNRKAILKIKMASFVCKWIIVFYSACFSILPYSHLDHNHPNCLPNF